ncbi:hypothetical protein ACFSWD_30370 [Paenibacillus xanthanilyticus]
MGAANPEARAISAPVPYTLDSGVLRAGRVLLLVGTAAFAAAIYRFSRRDLPL